MLRYLIILLVNTLLTKRYSSTLILIRVSDIVKKSPLLVINAVTTKVLPLRYLPINSSLPLFRTFNLSLGEESILPRVFSFPNRL